MQVRHPEQLHGRHRRRRALPKALLLLPLLVVVVGTYLYATYGGKSASDATSSAASASDATGSVASPAKKGVLRTFTGAQFRDLYNSIAYPNTQYISDETPITGNQAADTQIRKLATQRGYLARSAPVTDVFRNVGKAFVLQERAAQPWLDMQAAAKKDNINLGLTAAYRSAEDQKEIFLSRLQASNIAVSAIGSGQYDAQINQVLKTTAIPGFSRHHTGYTVDISCENNAGVSFEASICFNWLSKDNYKNAKTYGWIPSYPDGAGQQGPDPESWEYVWVGKDAVSE